MQFNSLMSEHVDVILPVQVAIGALEFYTNWTGVQQPLTKFDYVAVPGKGGAMENWGLLQFDERRMLVDPVSVACTLLYNLDMTLHKHHQPLTSCISVGDIAAHPIQAQRHTLAAAAQWTVLQQSA